MTRDELLQVLDHLYRNHHPVTGKPLGAASVLTLPIVQRELAATIGRLLCDVPDAPDHKAIAGCMADLRDLGYEPSPEQLVRVFTGSRSIADPRLRGLPAYRRYRGVFPKRTLLAILRTMDDVFAEAIPEVSEPAANDEEPDDWQTVDFFDEGAFDKMNPEKAADLATEVEALGMRKPSDRLPAFMARARQRIPRAFEPWTREERALLVEAMCYTNDLARLAEIFGRSAASLEREGKMLIWKSRREKAA